MVGSNPYNRVAIILRNEKKQIDRNAKTSASASVLDRAANALVIFRQARYHHTINQQGDHCQDERAGDNLGDDGVRVLLQREVLISICLD